MGEIRSHTGLRGVAALLVILYHFHFIQPHLPFEDYTMVFERTYLMVDLFFILSGFIISYVYNVEGRPLLPYREFMVRRLIRLYPLHLFCLMLYVVLYGLLQLGLVLSGNGVDAYLRHPDALESFVAQLFLLHAWLPIPPRWNIPSWSISAEMAAYALFPLLALMVRWRPVVGAMICVTLSVGFYGYVATHGGSLDITYLTAPFRCLAGFMLGMAVHQYRLAINRIGDATLSIIQIAAVVAIAGLLAVQVSDVTLIPPFVALVFSTWTDRGVVAVLLRGRLCHFLGEISYSVYLIHVPLMLVYPVHVFIGTSLHLDAMTIRALWLVLATSGILFAAYLSHRFVEVPMRRWLGRKWRGGPAAEEAETSPGSPAGRSATI